MIANLHVKAVVVKTRNGKKIDLKGWNIQDVSESKSRAANFQCVTNFKSAATVDTMRSAIPRSSVEVAVVDALVVEEAFLPVDNVMGRTRVNNLFWLAAA